MKFTDYIISENRTITDALRQLNLLSGRSITLFVVDSSGAVIGSLTDGDIRRSIIAGYTLGERVSNVMHTNFSALRGDKVDVNIIHACRERKITLLPHLNDDGTIRDIYDLSTLESILPIDAVLMAGGKGERLRPMTDNTPKPLLMVGEKAIINHNIDALLNNGISNINITVNYLGEQIEQHIKKNYPNQSGIYCIGEDKPLGTIGAVANIAEFYNDTILVMNSDLLTNINYEEFYLHHINSGADMSVAVVPYQVSVPFAIFTYDNDNKINGLAEKPTYNYYANAGIYLIKREHLSQVAHGERMDATDLIEKLLSEGLLVEQFPINGRWIDIGSPDDYRTACALLTSGV
ncbi:MAG: sugar phosphate nucleotidyltransferase [Bacteroidales bacterium]